MGLSCVTTFAVFWNEGGTYVFYAESLNPETRRGTLSSIDDRRAPFRTGPRELPASPESARGVTKRPGSAPSGGL
jgi:hypothetical protein